jgi:hypothetical protein
MTKEIRFCLKVDETPSLPGAYAMAIELADPGVVMLSGHVFCRDRHLDAASESLRDGRAAVCKLCGSLPQAPQPRGSFARRIFCACPDRGGRCSRTASAGNGDFNISRIYGQLSRGPLKGSKGRVNSDRIAVMGQ